MRQRCLLERLTDGSRLFVRSRQHGDEHHLAPATVTGATAGVGRQRWAILWPGALLAGILATLTLPASCAGVAHSSVARSHAFGPQATLSRSLSPPNRLHVMRFAPPSYAVTPVIHLSRGHHHLDRDERTSYAVTLVIHRPCGHHYLDWDLNTY